LALSKKIERRTSLNDIAQAKARYAANDGRVSEILFEYDGTLYPEYIRNGNACRFILPVAEHYCKGIGVDVGCGEWPLPGAIPIELKHGQDAMTYEYRNLDFCFSSHALEHLVDPIGALLHWIKSLRNGGVLFCYLPHPAMRYWNPTKNRKHLHIWTPEQMVEIFKDLGLANILYSERDLAWSFCVVGFKP
jgi:SAM-dependent methyltransferase